MQPRFLVQGEGDANGADGGRKQMLTVVSDSQLVPCVPAQYQRGNSAGTALAAGCHSKPVLFPVFAFYIFNEIAGKR